MSIIEKALDKKAEQGGDRTNRPADENTNAGAEIFDGQVDIPETRAADVSGDDPVVVPARGDTEDRSGLPEDEVMSFAPDQGASAIPAENDTAAGVEDRGPVAERLIDSAEKNKRAIPGITGRYVSIDLAAMEAKGMLIPDGGPTQLAEQYRQIKRPLLMNAFPEGDNGIKNSNLVLVTSSLPGEGKTYTAVNLAISIATERDKTVLLVDADVAKPSVNKVLGIDIKMGLIDMLVDPGIQFSDVLLRTDIPKLSIIPAGRMHKHSTELLASDEMRRLTREMSARYSDRIIIFDSPPLMAASQGSVLCNLVGQVIMVIESDVTPQHVVQEAISKLDDCEVVGCVLNKTKQGFGLNYYAYGNYGR